MDDPSIFGCLVFNFAESTLRIAGLARDSNHKWLVGRAIG
jgi:hypothetical protein